MSLSRNRDPVIQDNLKMLLGAVSYRCYFLSAKLHRNTTQKETHSISSQSWVDFLLHSNTERQFWQITQYRINRNKSQRIRHFWFWHELPLLSLLLKKWLKWLLMKLVEDQLPVHLSTDRFSCSSSRVFCVLVEEQSVCCVFWDLSFKASQNMTRYTHCEISLELK